MNTSTNKTQNKNRWIKQLFIFKAGIILGIIGKILFAKFAVLKMGVLLAYAGFANVVFGADIPPHLQALIDQEIVSEEEVLYMLEYVGDTAPLQMLGQEITTTLSNNTITDIVSYVLEDTDTSPDILHTQ